MAHIKTYTRIKPTDDVESQYDLSDGCRTLIIRDPVDVQDEVRPPDTRAGHHFKCSYVFTEKASQADVFRHAAHDIVEGFLAGYNGTIFAYGQTGTGKTYTMTGSARRYDDRGLAPRTLSMIYERLEAEKEADISIHVSYMEIYQEVGYDLLNPGARAHSVVTTLPKVTVVEGVKGSCLVRNLSTHLAANEQVAQNLLLQGQANRRVAETSLNHRSSRSHAIFTIQLMIRHNEAELITRSKLHLVDLAGSERVAKSGVKGSQLVEAKFINLSLHHLEGVIIALQQESGLKAGRPKVMCNRWMTDRPESASSTGDGNRTKHVPYRNSLLTMVLRDSLGGNCQTAMIATISFRLHHLNETLSTCRFAQRVACVTNTIWKNEEIDDKSMIKKLQEKVAQLETQLALKGSSEEGDLLGNEMQVSAPSKDIDCIRIIQEYLIGRVKDPILAGVRSTFNIRECFRIMKSIILDLYARPKDGSSVRPLNLPGKSAVLCSTKKAIAHLPQVIFDRAGNNKATLQAQPTKPAFGNASRSQGVNKQQLRREYTPKREEPKTANRGRNLTRPTSASLSKQKPTSRTEPQKSPYEQKREAQAIRSDSKPNNVKVNQQQQQEQQQQQRHLAETDTKMKHQQLQLIRNEISNRLEQNQQRLIEQQTMLTQVQQHNASFELVEQEKLMEKQLQNRQAKMEKRLELINGQLEESSEIKKSAPRKGPVVNTVKTNTKTEDRLEESVKDDGKAETTKVMENLHVEEKPQQQGKEVKINLEGQTSNVLNNAIKVKEAETRKKLLDFREKLQKAKLSKMTGAVPASTHLSTPSGASQTLGPSSRPLHNLGPSAMRAQLIGQQAHMTGSNFSAQRVSPKAAPDNITHVAASSQDVVASTKGGGDANQSSVTSKLSNMRRNSKDLGRCDLLRHISGGVSSNAGLAKPAKRSGVQSIVTDRQTAAGVNQSSVTSRQQNAQISKYVSDGVSSSAGLMKPAERNGVQSTVTSADLKLHGGGEKSMLKTESSVISCQQDQPNNRYVSDGVSSNCLLKRDETTPVKMMQPSTSTRICTNEPAGNAEVTHDPAGQSNSPSDCISYTCRSPGDTTCSHVSRLSSGGSPRDLAKAAGQFRMAEQEAYVIARQSLDTVHMMSGVEERYRPAAATCREYDAFARPNITQGSGKVGGATEINGILGGGGSGNIDVTASKGEGHGPTSINGEGDRRTENVTPTWGPNIKDLPIAEKIAMYMNSRKSGNTNGLSQPPVVTPRKRPSVTPTPAPRRSSPVPVPRIRAMPENERKATYMKVAQEERARVACIRRAQRAAEVIQRSWRRHQQYTEA